MVDSQEQVEKKAEVLKVISSVVTVTPIIPVKVMSMSKENDRVVNVSIVDELSEDDAAANAARAESEEQAASDAADFEARQAQEQTALENRGDEQVSLDNGAPIDNAEDKNEG